MAHNYPKINTLFLRDENSIIIPDKFTCPEFEFLKDCKWECTEKIDGTNIHIDYNFKFDYNDDGSLNDIYLSADICGRTERAKIPQHLYDKLNKIFCCSGSKETAGDNEWNDWYHKISTTFGAAVGKAIANYQPELTICIYGEGYGVKIQKGGGSYLRNDVGFILFDIRVGEWWLKRSDCESIADLLGVPIVPLVGYMTIQEAIDYTKNGFKSNISEDKNLDAEGLVLKTPDHLRFRSGERIITKIKTADFQKFKAKYGDSQINQAPGFWNHK